MSNVDIGYNGMIIGELFLYDILDEVVYKGNLKSKGQIKGGDVNIIVYGDEGNGKPHFHIKKNNGESFSKNPNEAGDCCVLLNKAEFWPHDNHKTVLKKSQMKQIDAWLRLPNENEPNKTNWEVACELWETQNDSSVGVDKQPDYTKMGR